MNSIKGIHPPTFYFTQTHWIKTPTNTVWFTVLRLMEVSIFIKLAISNSTQLQKEHAPVYFCYIPSSKELRSTYAVYQLVSFLLWSLYFSYSVSDLWYPKRKLCLVIKHQMPSTQPICHTSVSVLALTPTSILALKHAREVSEATERMLTLH